jgi:flagellar biosynthesis activator protein FlaF
VLQNALKAYQSVEKETISGRETEARVLTQGAVKLIDCQRNWDAPDRRARLNTALTYNQRIWSIFQVEVSDPMNPLPRDIKRNIMHLSHFIDRRIFDIMAFPAPEKLNVLININRNIAAGLRGDGMGPID